MNKVIEVTVDPKGNAKVETKGFAGGDCRDASRFVEAALGRAASETLTPEFHLGTPARRELRQPG